MTGQDSEVQWYIARDGKQHGPLTDVEMRTFVAHNYLRASDLIWRPGMPEWQPAPLVFPEALPEAAQKPAQNATANQPAASAPAQARASRPAPAAREAAPSAARHLHSSDFDAGHEHLPPRSRRKTLAFAAAAMTALGGAFALAAYHQPLMDTLLGGPETATAEVDPPVVAAADEDGATQSAEASPTSEGNTTAATGTSAATTTPAAQTTANLAAPGIATTASPTTTSSVTSSIPPSTNGTQVAAVQPESSTQPPPPSIDGSPMDEKLQKIPVWALIKKEYPDWYTTEIRQANTLIAEKKPDSEVAMLLARGLVNLRRQFADKALSASSDKLEAIAVAFLNHLKALRAESVTACFGFISKGETSPAVIKKLEHPATATALNAQIGAIFEAISEGTKNPVKHDAAVKSDYDVLIKELAKLGWKEEDLQVFSNPKLLAQRQPAQVCKMVQDWFVAHLAVKDKDIRDRLLFETLKPVVSG
jgi:hypothetical protein